MKRLFSDISETEPDRNVKQHVDKFTLQGILPEIWEHEILPKLPWVSRVHCRSVCQRFCECDKNIHLPKWVADVIIYTHPSLLPFGLEPFLSQLRILGWPSLPFPKHFGTDTFTTRIQRNLDMGRYYTYAFAVEWQWGPQMVVFGEVSADDPDVMQWGVSTLTNGTPGTWKTNFFRVDANILGLFRQKEVSDARKYLADTYNLELS